MKRIDFSRWGRDHTQQGGAVPYLDIEGEDEPIEFLFRYKGEHLLIARGNLQTCKGREKMGKSAAGIMLIVAALGGSFLDLQPQRGDLSVLWIDCEQDRATLRKRAKAALQMAGQASTIDRLKICTLKATEPAQRLETALNAIKETQADFVFLDGAVDLCEDFNDNKAAAKVVDALLKATDEANCSILSVIHTNKKDDEARGHLGTILQQKSSEIYEVSKAGDIARVRQELCRFAAVPDIAFKFGEAFTIEPAEGGAYLDAKAQELKDLFAPLFGETSKQYKHNDLAKAYVERHGGSTKTAQRRIKEATEKAVLFKSDSGQYSYLFPDIGDCEDEDNI